MDNGKSVWYVQINGISAGVLDELQVQEISESISADRVRLVCAQVVNVLYCGFRVFSHALASTPLVMVLAAIVHATVFPESFSEVWNTSTPSQLLMMSFTTAFFVSIPVTVFTFILGAKHGFINKFSAEKARLAREKLNILADGEVSITECLRSQLHTVTAKRDF